MKIIGKVYTDMPDKFGIPRQSGLVKSLTGKIIFEPEYSVKEAFEGIEDFSHLWILWQFSENIRDEFSPTVRPPRLNGNTRKGVFATRSPFRPNPIGLSCVKLEKAEYTKNHGMVLYISGVDMKNETPVYDIKPYVSYCDCVKDAVSGFADDFKDYSLNVEFSQNHLCRIPEDKRQAIMGILSQDPRPAYQNQPDRIYGVRFLDFDVKFKVEDGVLTVTDVISV